MSDESKVEKSFESVLPPISLTATEVVQIQMRAWLVEQAELLDQTQKAWAGWMKRRHDAMEASLRTFQAMCSCKDPAGLTAVYGEWLTNSMNRIIADMNDARDQALQLAEIPQKSAAVLFGHGADFPQSPAGTASSAVAEREAGRPNGARWTEAVHERSAAG